MDFQKEDSSAARITPRHNLRTEVQEGCTDTLSGPDVARLSAALDCRVHQPQQHTFNVV